MKKSTKGDLKRAVAETNKMLSRDKERAFRAELQKRLDNVKVSTQSIKLTDYYKNAITAKYSVSLGQITSWAKDFYIGFDGKKSLDECIALAYSLEGKSCNFAIAEVSKDDDNFSSTFAKGIQTEFFNNAERISLKDVSNLFFKDATSKEIQGRRVRRQDDFFDRLLHCAFAFILEDCEFDSDSYFRFEHRNIVFNPNSSYALLFNEDDCESIKTLLKNGLNAQNFYRLLTAYLSEWDKYCTLKKS